MSSKELYLLPPGTVLRITVLMPHHRNAKFRTVMPIGDGVRKVVQRMNAPAFCTWCAEARMLLQQRGHALELVQKPPRYAGPSLRLVEAKRLLQVTRRKAVDGSLH